MSIFSEMTALALAHGAVNLGQGFPDFAPPEFVVQAAHRALEQGHHQYARSAGLPELAQVLARQMGPSFGRSLDAEAEVTVTVGATEGLFATIMALVRPADEVVLLEPFYDAYPADVALAGGRSVYVPLRPDSRGAWHLDPDELRAAFSPQTRLIVLNTPHNPTGKVFDARELELIAELCQAHDALALCDEVYEHIVFDDRAHLRLASLPGMWERTLTLGSAGKTFSVTGWKIGWATAPQPLSTALREIHQWISFAVTTPLQAAVAHALVEADRRNYHEWLRAMYQDKRDMMVRILSQVGLRPLVPRGTYFVMADISSAGFADDVAFCRHLTTRVGVAAIPPSAFYSPPHQQLGRQLARFCFCKEEATMHAAAGRLAALTRG